MNLDVMRQKKRQSPGIKPRTPLASAASALPRATTAGQPPALIIRYMYCTQMEF